MFMRKGKPEDANDFCKLVLLSGATLYPTFGKSVENLMVDLFLQPKNIYSRGHTNFVVVRSQIAGMTLGYSWEEMKAEQRQTRKLMVNSLKSDFYLRFFDIRKVHKIFNNNNKDEFRWCNIAVYPEFRGMGLAQKLILKIEEEARKHKSKKITLDVKIDNKAAIGLYKKVGFVIEKKYPPLKLGDDNFEFFKMVKDISYCG